MTPLSSAAKKAYEVGYALYRVAAVLPARSFGAALEQEGLHLFWNTLHGSTVQAQAGTRALYYLISFGKDAGVIHPENAELLVRQVVELDGILAAAVSSPVHEKLVALDLSRVFSSSSAPAISPAASAAAAPAKGTSAAAGSPKSQLKDLHQGSAATHMPEMARKEVAAFRTATATENNPATAELALAPSQKERQEKILEKIRQSGNCRTADLQAVFPDLSERTLRYDLQRLVEQGKIERGGAGPASWYRIRGSAPTTAPAVAMPAHAPHTAP